MLLTDHPRSGLRRSHRRESSLPPPQAVKPASATTRHTRLIARHEPVRPRPPEPARLEHKSRSGLHRSLRTSRPKTTRTEAAHSRGSTHSRHPCHRDAERARRYRRRGTRPYWPITCGVNRKPPARCFATQSANDKCSSAPNEHHRITGPASTEKPCGPRLLLVQVDCARRKPRRSSRPPPPFMVVCGGRAARSSSRTVARSSMASS